MRSTCVRILTVVAVLVALVWGNLSSSATGRGDTSVSAADAPAAGSVVSATVDRAAAPPASAPNIYFYNHDGLRDTIPGQSLDPLQFMPKLRAVG